MSCAKCKHSKEAEPDVNNIGASKPLLCKRYPPQTIAVPTQQGLQIITSFPQVNKDMECGELINLKPLV